jgi:hypothetical protein
MSYRISAGSRPSSGVFRNRLSVGLPDLEVADLFGHGNKLPHQVAKTMILV